MREVRAHRPFLLSARGHDRRGQEPATTRRAEEAGIRTRGRSASAAPADAAEMHARDGEPGRATSAAARTRPPRPRGSRSPRATRATARKRTATRTASTANTGSAELCSHGEKTVQRPASTLSASVCSEIDRRRADEREEPEARRELDADARRAARGPGDAMRAPRRAAACAFANAPREPREHQRDADLHAGEQERVVVGVRVADAADVAADVEPVRQAAPGELGDEREQARARGSREAAGGPARVLMPGA